MKFPSVGVPVVLDTSLKLRGAVYGYDKASLYKQEKNCKQGERVIHILKAKVL
jgi:hypothetical protein